MTDLAAASRGPAAFIAEALFGNAGGIVLPDGYLREAYGRSARRAGSRSPTRCRWATDDSARTAGRSSSRGGAGHRHRGQGDGKRMAVGAVITTRAIADAFGARAGSSPRSAARPVGARRPRGPRRDRRGGAAGERTVNGAHLKAGLERATEGHQLVGAVHGMGLYMGVELVRDRDTLEPAAAEAMAISERMLDLGVIVQPTGDGNNVLKVKPPLCFTPASADLVAGALEIALRGW